MRARFAVALLCSAFALAHAEESCVAAGEWRDGHTRLPLPQSAVLQRAAAGPIVMLGEKHDDPRHHDWQLQVLRALHAANPDFILAMEIFPRRVQPILDRWAAGEYGEYEFLRAVEWQKIWGGDAELYFPLLRFARDHRIPIRALNVESSLIREVAARGLEAVAPERREGVTRPAPADALYLERLRRAYAEHGRGVPGPDDPAFLRFVAAQQVWDRAMAQGIADAHRARPRHLIAAIMGSGHLLDLRGVPQQLRDLQSAPGMVILPWDVAQCADFKPGVADAVYGIGP